MTWDALLVHPSPETPAAPRGLAQGLRTPHTVQSSVVVFGDGDLDVLGYRGPMDGITRIARLVGWAGLTAAGALHAIWASGSPWPAKSPEQLGEAVVGGSDAMPDSRATRVVSGAAFAGGFLAAGGLGEGRLAVGVRRLMGAGLLARAVFGGEAALSVLGLPPGGETFRELDRRYYRSLFGLLGVALIVGAKKKDHGQPAAPML